MVSSKLQNVVIRTMRSDLEFLESGGMPATIEQAADETEELLRRAQSAIRQAESERGAMRPIPSVKPTDQPVAKVSAVKEKDLNILQEKVRQKAEAERKRLEEEALQKAEAERKRLEEEARQKAEAERKRLEEEALQKAEAERKRLEEEDRQKAERAHWEKILAEAETAAQTWHIFSDIDDLDKTSELLAQKEHEIELLQLQLKEFPAQEKLILPEKKKIEGQKNQSEKEYQKLLNRLEEIERTRNNIEQLENKARSSEERRRYEEKRWQLANRQREVEQEKWVKKDELAEINTALNRIESSASGLQGQKNKLESRLQDLNLEKEEILLGQKKVQIKQRLIELDLAKEKPLRLIEKLEAQKTDLRSELQPILREEKIIERKEAELKRQIKAAVSSDEKKKLTEQRWNIEKERERIEKKRWQVEQKAIALRDQYKHAVVPHQMIINEERDLYKKLREIDVLIAYGVSRGREKLDERVQKKQEAQSQKFEKTSFQLEEDVFISESQPLESVLSEDEKTGKNDVIQKKGDDHDQEHQTLKETIASEAIQSKPVLPTFQSSVSEKRAPAIDEIDTKKQKAREKLEEEMIEQRKAMEEKQAEIEKIRQSSLPKTPPATSEEKIQSIEEPVIKKPQTARDVFINQLMSSSAQEEIDREKFLQRVRGEGNFQVPNNPLETQVQEGVIFRPMPQSPDRGQKLVARILIILLVIGLGVLAYLIFKGYLL